MDKQRKVEIYLLVLVIVIVRPFSFIFRFEDLLWLSFLLQEHLLLLFLLVVPINSDGDSDSYNEYDGNNSSKNHGARNNNWMIRHVFGRLSIEVDVELSTPDSLG